MYMSVCLHIYLHMYITHVQRKTSELAFPFFPYKKTTGAEGRVLYYPHNYLTWSLRFAWTEQVMQD